MAVYLADPENRQLDGVIGAGKGPLEGAEPWDYEVTRQNASASVEFRAR